MSGSLRRLAGRALGLVSPVRSSARLPYAGAPALDVETHELAPAAEIAAPPPPTAVATWLASPMPPLVTPDEPVTGSPADTLPAAHDGSPRPGRRAAADPGATSPARASSRAVPPPPLLVSRPGQEARGPEGLVPGRKRDETNAEAVDEAGSPALPRTVRETFAVPPALLPPPARRTVAPRVVNATSPTAPPPAGGAPQRPADETPEIHVSIGRIEVTAVHDAPPPKRRAARTRKPTTLDEYLAQRRGERA